MKSGWTPRQDVITDPSLEAPVSNCGIIVVGSIPLAVLRVPVLPAPQEQVFQWPIRNLIDDSFKLVLQG
jgi:hypothetical protein